MLIKLDILNIVMIVKRAHSVIKRLNGFLKKKIIVFYFKSRVSKLSNVKDTAVENDRRMLWKAGKKSDSNLAFLNVRETSFKFDLSRAARGFDRKLRARHFM